MRPTGSGHRRLAQLLFLTFTCLACTGGSFTCNSDKDDDDKIIVTTKNK